MKWTLFDVCFIISILSFVVFSLFETSALSSSIVAPIWKLFFSSVWGFRMDLLGFAIVFFKVAPDLKFVVCRLWVFLVAPDFWVLNCVIFLWKCWTRGTGLTEAMLVVDLGGRDVLLLFRVDGGSKLFRPANGSFLLASFATAGKLFLPFAGLLTQEVSLSWIWFFEVVLMPGFAFVALAASFAGWLNFVPFFARPVVGKLLRPMKRDCDCLTFDIAERLFLPTKVSRTNFVSPGLVEARDFCVPVLAGRDFLSGFNCPYS